MGLLLWVECGPFVANGKGGLGIVLIWRDYGWMRKRLYEGKNNNARKIVKVMGLDIFFFFLFFQFPFRMTIVCFSLMYNIVIHILVYCVYLNLIWNLIFGT